MANTVTSIKRIRITERRTEINRMRKSRLRTQLRAQRRLVAAKNVKDAQDEMPKTFSMVDRAARWGIIKQNTAARYKSRLTLQLRKLAA